MNCEKAKRKFTNFRMGDFPFFLLTAVGNWQLANSTRQKSLEEVSIFFANRKSI
jgi:hypothetical protein